MLGIGCEADTGGPASLPVWHLIEPRALQWGTRELAVRVPPAFLAIVPFLIL